MAGGGRHHRRHIRRVRPGGIGARGARLARRARVGRHRGVHRRARDADVLTAEGTPQGSAGRAGSELIAAPRCRPAPFRCSSPGQIRRVADRRSGWAMMRTMPRISDTAVATSISGNALMSARPTPRTLVLTAMT